MQIKTPLKCHFKSIGMAHIKIIITEILESRSVVKSPWDALFWALLLPGMHRVHSPTSEQNTHTHDIKQTYQKTNNKQKTEEDAEEEWHTVNGNVKISIESPFNTSRLLGIILKRIECKVYTITAYMSWTRTALIGISPVDLNPKQRTRGNEGMLRAEEMVFPEKSTPVIQYQLSALKTCIQVICRSSRLYLTI